ncbi:hypothetical protein Tco_0789383 [Tanacetum coccineum]
MVITTSPDNLSTTTPDTITTTNITTLTWILSSETLLSGTPPLLPIPLPTLSPPLFLPSTDCRAGVFEATLPPQKRLCIALGPRYEVGESLSAPTARPTRGCRADYGFISTLDDKIRRDPKRYVSYGITKLGRIWLRTYRGHQ